MIYFYENRRRGVPPVGRRFQFTLDLWMEYFLQDRAQCCVLLNYLKPRYLILNSGVPPGLCLTSLPIPPLHKLKWLATLFNIWTITQCPHTGSVKTSHLLLGLRRAVWSSPSSVVQLLAQGVNTSRLGVGWPPHLIYKVRVGVPKIGRLL